MLPISTQQYKDRGCKHSIKVDESKKENGSLNRSSTKKSNILYESVIKVLSHRQEYL